MAVIIVKNLEELKEVVIKNLKEGTVLSVEFKEKEEHDYDEDNPE